MWGLCGVGAYSHGSNLTVRSRGVPCLSNSEVEEGQEIEDIGKGGVEAIVVGRVTVTYVIELGDWGGVRWERRRKRKKDRPCLTTSR